ncbi:type IV secretory pathway VirB2 component (pilin) [Nocardioides thalensis]|uniref:Type IV secretory pathway VirB2 component (Pilin) n=1 Tax=Nocardioides thalensis TaxID=1914755 RepID=A0A853BYC7_9ACTN|nr:hypothetical protein [Nocardioides thalensis]NYJ00950.1 type IV secretory pathway VirB2 component (pilin) [Nocardioides thalensis]
MFKSDQRAGPRLRRVLALLVTVATVALVTQPAPAEAGRKGWGSPVVAVTDEGSMRAPVRYRSDDGWFRGRFVPSSFEVVGEEIVAHGTVTGLAHEKGDRTRKVSEDVSLPVALSGATGGGQATMRGPGLAGGMAAAAATCDVLNLVLGPLDLNLLGLEIHLDQVVLDIIANPAGGLLGDLLCAVANLLDGGPLAGLLAQLTDLLEQILGALNLGG